MCAIMGFSKKSRTKEEIIPYFDRTLSRGPDMSEILETPSGWLCFHRLAIMGLDESGMQPFSLDGDMVVCNGELYGWRSLKSELEEKGYTFQSGSDCELLLPMYREYGLDMFSMLDAEYALVLYDSKTDSLVAARDPIGIRPLFYGYDYDGGIVFASEATNAGKPVGVDVNFDNIGFYAGVKSLEKTAGGGRGSFARGKCGQNALHRRDEPFVLRHRADRDAREGKVAADGVALLFQFLAQRKGVYFAVDIEEVCAGRIGRKAHFTQRAGQIVAAFLGLAKRHRGEFRVVQRGDCTGQSKLVGAKIVGNAV